MLQSHWTRPPVNNSIFRLLLWLLVRSQLKCHFSSAAFSLTLQDWVDSPSTCSMIHLYNRHSQYCLFATQLLLCGPRSWDCQWHASSNQGYWPNPMEIKFFLEIQTKTQDNKCQLVVSAVAKSSSVQSGLAVTYNVNAQRKLEKDKRRTRKGKKKYAWYYLLISKIQY